jgi:hypothetical protein
LVKTASSFGPNTVTQMGISSFIYCMIDLE